MFRLLSCLLLAASLLLSSCGSDAAPSATANEPINTDDSTGVGGAQATQSVQLSTQAGPAPGPAQ